MPGVRFRLRDLLCWRRPDRRRNVTELETELKNERMLRMSLEHQLEEEKEWRQRLLEELNVRKKYQEHINMQANPRQGIMEENQEKDVAGKLREMEEKMVKEKDAMARKMREMEEKMVKEQQNQRMLQENLVFLQEKWMKKSTAMAEEKETMSRRIRVLETLRMKDQEERKELEEKLEALKEEVQKQTAAAAAGGAGYPEEELSELKGGDLDPEKVDELRQDEVQKVQMIENLELQKRLLVETWGCSMESVDLFLRKMYEPLVFH